MVNEETLIQNDIKFSIGRRSDTTCWRNNTGELKDSSGRRVKFGLCEGSSDLVLLVTIKVTPEMVGKDIGVFGALEVKTPTGKPTAEQLNFIRHVNDRGGIGFIARSVDEASNKLNEAIARMQAAA
jgi:hypothetical protein